MNAILVSVDYADYLSLTLPYNRHHFERVVVVTSPDDPLTPQVARANWAEVYQTDAFYAGGARFNKWKALEEGLDVLGREGWICIMDADVLWPRCVSLDLEEGHLYTPLRRMAKAPSEGLPDESTWANYPLHRQQLEWAGYTQIFHGSDRRLGNPPWHQTNWRHAGGADSFFQLKWPDRRKLRPSFEVLHLGESGKNWCGRATSYLDGSHPPNASEKIQEVRQFIRGRRKVRGVRKFDDERL